MGRVRKTGKKTRKDFHSSKEWLDDRFRKHPEEFDRLREISSFCADHPELRQERLSPYEALIRFYAVGKKGRSSDKRIAEEFGITEDKSRISRKVGLCILTDGGRKGAGHWKFHSKIRNRVENILKLFNQEKEKETMLAFDDKTREALGKHFKDNSQVRLNLEEMSVADVQLKKSQGMDSLFFSAFEKFYDNEQAPKQVAFNLGIAENEARDNLLIAIDLIGFSHNGEVPKEVKKEADVIRTAWLEWLKTTAQKQEIEEDKSAEETGAVPEPESQVRTVVIPEIAFELWEELATNPIVKESDQGIFILRGAGSYLDIFEKSLRVNYPKHTLNREQIRRVWGNHFSDKRKRIARFMEDEGGEYYEVLYPTSHLIKVDIIKNTPHIEEALCRDIREEKEVSPISPVSAPTVEGLTEAILEDPALKEGGSEIQKSSPADILVTSKNEGIDLEKALLEPTQASLLKLQTKLQESSEAVQQLKSALKRAEAMSVYIRNLLSLQEEFLKAI